jgi:hypothetical protein
MLLSITHISVSTLQLPACNDPAPNTGIVFQSIHKAALLALVQAGVGPYASDSLLWTRLIVDAVNGDEVAVTELVAAAEELTRRLEQNGHFARTTVQLAELSSHHRRREQLRAALTALMLQLRAR